MAWKYRQAAISASELEPPRCPTLPTPIISIKSARSVSAMRSSLRMVAVSVIGRSLPAVNVGTAFARLVQGRCDHVQAEPAAGEVAPDRLQVLDCEVAPEDEPPG